MPGSVRGTGNGCPGHPGKGSIATLRPLEVSPKVSFLPGYEQKRYRMIEAPNWSKPSRQHGSAGGVKRLLSAG